MTASNADFSNAASPSDVMRMSEEACNAEPGCSFVPVEDSLLATTCPEDPMAGNKPTHMCMNVPDGKCEYSAQAPCASGEVKTMCLGAACEKTSGDDKDVDGKDVDSSDEKDNKG